MNAVVDHDILGGLASDGWKGYSPYLYIAVVETSDGVFVVPVEMDLRDGGFLFD